MWVTALHACHLPPPHQHHPHRPLPDAPAALAAPPAAGAARSRAPPPGAPASAAARACASRATAGTRGPASLRQRGTAGVAAVHACRMQRDHPGSPCGCCAAAQNAPLARLASHHQCPLLVPAARAPVSVPPSSSAWSCSSLVGSARSRACSRSYSAAVASSPPAAWQGAAGSGRRQEAGVGSSGSSSSQIRRRKLQERAVPGVPGILPRGMQRRLHRGQLPRPNQSGAGDLPTGVRRVVFGGLLEGLGGVPGGQVHSRQQRALARDHKPWRRAARGAGGKPCCGAEGSRRVAQGGCGRQTGPRKQAARDKRCKFASLYKPQTERAP